MDILSRLNGMMGQGNGMAGGPAGGGMGPSLRQPPMSPQAAYGYAPQGGQPPMPSPGQLMSMQPSVETTGTPQKQTDIPGQQPSGLPGMNNFMNNLMTYLQNATDYGGQGR